MGNFNIISLFVGACSPNICATQEAQTPTNGVYIQDVNGKLWKTEDWDGSAVPNAIAVITDEAKFLMTLERSDLAMSDSSRTEIDRYMFGTSCYKLAISDYDGAGNTANILKVQPSIDYAAGYCSAFTFPDGKTKGYLPSFGQLKLAYENKGKIKAALSKCGGTAMGASDCYWSSTFRDVYDVYRYCWVLGWGDNDFYSGELGDSYYVRPFADF